MAIDERRVENKMKEYRLGRWNVGQQKGLVQYDPDTYDRERQELFAEITEDFDSGKPDIVTEMVSDIYDLEKTSEEEADEEEARAVQKILAAEHVAEKTNRQGKGANHDRENLDEAHNQKDQG